MVRGDSRPHRNHCITSNSHGRAGISLDSNPYLVPRSHVSSRLCESECTDAPRRDWISASDPPDSNFLNDSLPIFHRRLPTRPLRPGIRPGSTSRGACESGWECMGSLQADRSECLEDVQDLQPLSLSALSRNDSGCSVEGLG